MSRYACVRPWKIFIKERLKTSNFDLMLVVRSRRLDLVSPIASLSSQVGNRRRCVIRSDGMAGSFRPGWTWRRRQRAG